MKDYRVVYEVQLYIQSAWLAPQGNNRGALRSPPHSSLPKEYGAWREAGLQRGHGNQNRVGFRF